MFKTVTFFFVIFLSITAFADFTGKVVKVTDGDTINVLESGNILHKVRLTGIDAPERSQPYGRKSADHLASMVAGMTVTIESGRKDRYGRDLGKVLIDGQDINLEQVKAGMAWWYEYYKKQQSLKDQRLYAQAEQDARNGKLGLWADPHPVNPHEWRRNH